ncbi:MAG: amidoligase family protein [Gammaproteobacteria bacterium]|nr:amidoligase family protein [Gammaproteobacteria bacterium]
MTQTTCFAPLPVATQDDGTPRRVGFELEFSGVTLREAVEAMRDALGGTAAKSSAAEWTLEVESLGIFNIELDWDYLKRKAAKSEEEEPDEEWLEHLSRAAALLVPVEVVCPPIDVDDLDRLAPMTAALREAGAVGTEESLIAAYGVHVNTESPSLEAATVAAYLRAFGLLQWWLVDHHEVDATRRISPYIDLFPETYVALVLGRSEDTIDTLFDDYLKHNATRNRALDLLPLLAEIDPDRVRRTIDDPRIKARPTFHYRLPDCRIERDDWSLAGAWTGWLVVERLANQPDELARLGEAFLDAARPLLGVRRKHWVETMDAWVRDHASA